MILLYLSLMSECDPHKLLSNQTTMRKIVLAFTLLIYTLLLSLLLYGCEREKSVSGDEFPASRVKALFIDESGVVWAGTDAGIISYWEGKWTTYKDVNKLPSGEVTDIAFQLSNFGKEIWLGTYNGAGVAGYEKDAVTSATFYTKDSSALLDNRINAVLVDAQDARWFATPGGLSIFRGSNWYSETDWDDLIGNPVISLGGKSDGWVFAGTNGLGVGRFMYDETIDGITGASYYNTDWTALPSDTILCVYVDENGHQWFGTPKGAAHHTAWETKLDWEVYSVDDGLIHNRVQAITGDNDNLVWFGTEQGVSSFDGEQWKSYTAADGLVHPSVNDIAVDAAGMLWFATDGGISIFDGTTWKNFSR